jgi:hypothetical protein
VLLFFSCAPASSGTKKFKRINLETNPLFYYSNVGTLNEAPVALVETWNRAALKKMGVRRITLFSKGGKNPDDTLERITFDYSNKWRTMNYEGYKFDEARDAWTLGTVAIPDRNQTGQIVFTRHFGIDKRLKTIVQPIENGILFLRDKGDDRFDTTWVVGTLERPKAIVSKIGNSIFSAEVYLPEGSSTKDIMRRFNQLPLAGGQIGTAHCSVIFTKGGKPQRAFLLNDRFSQVAKIREWTYNADNTISTYHEWMGASVTREMSWHYGKSQLPEYTVIDRNTYFYHYE